MDAVGIQEATLVGDSSGGMIAQRVALEYLRRVSRLVPIDAPTTLVSNEAKVEAGQRMLAELQDPIRPELVRGFWESTIHHPVPDVILRAAVSQSLRVPARVWRAYHEGVSLALDDTARLGEIGVPTLILWGERDAILGRAEQERRAAAIPDATFEVYPETGHAVAVERPGWVARDLQRFIETTRSATQRRSALRHHRDRGRYPRGGGVLHRVASARAQLAWAR